MKRSHVSSQTTLVSNSGRVVHSSHKSSRCRQSLMARVKVTLFSFTIQTCRSCRRAGSATLHNERFVLQQSNVLTYAQPEVIEGMPVDAIQFANHGNSKFHDNPNLGLLSLFVLIEQIIQSFHCGCWRFINVWRWRGWYATMIWHISFCTWLFSWPGVPLSPAAAMYVLPIVLIFSTPLNFGLDSSCRD